MDPSFAFVQFLNGLASASSLFIIASGLTLVFGVTRIVNFAHGSLYMLGAYIAAAWFAPAMLGTWNSLPMFILMLIATGIAVGCIGLAMEVLLLRRIYHAPELLQLLATFGVVLIVQDLVIRVWGPLEILGPRAPGLRHAIPIFGRMVPAYDLFLIAAGPVVLGLLYLLMQRTRFGVLVRAATQDREMVGALGVNQALLFTGTLFLGAFLAGLGGALQIPKTAANAQMDISILSETFVVTVIGGMGSIPGAFLASLLIGQLQAFGILVFPKITLVLVFLAMAVVLVLRPQGLLGRPEAPSSRPTPPEGFVLLTPPGATAAKLAGIVLVVLAALPLAADAYMLKVAIEVFIFALAAFSLSLLIGNGGIVSFGHAAYFGVGAYAAGLLFKRYGITLVPALVIAPLLAGAVAALYGAFIVRLSGIYLAMLTLAFAQITYAIAFQWVEITGGDNGIVGVWPPAWASGRIVYYYLTLALATLGIWALLAIIHSPFGYALRAARDSQTRAEAIGLEPMQLRLAAFTLAGVAAGLAGALYAFSKGSIDPTLLSIPQSVDFLAMILTGGIQAIAGAVAGAGVFHVIKDLVMPLTAYWRALMGTAIIAIVLLFPHGIAGAAERLGPRLFARRQPA
jgi:branched-chain amino acid transport system permease protein